MSGGSLEGKVGAPAASAVGSGCHCRNRLHHMRIRTKTTLMLGCIIQYYVLYIIQNT